jgi:hypothetical protein
MSKDNALSQYEIPRNSLSCVIGRICETPDDNFEADGILWVDIDDLDGSKNGPPHGEEGTTQRKAIASWTLRAAYVAWNRPPKIKFKGSAKMTGRITMSNAQLSNINISGGPPLQGTITSPSGPGTATVPVAISSASGNAKIEQSSDAEIEMTTDDNLDIELTSQKAAQLPWCVNDSGNSTESESCKEDSLFIKKGDFALCLALGNSLSNLYVIDIFK